MVQPLTLPCPLPRAFFKALLGPLQFFFKLPAPQSFCHRQTLFQASFPVLRKPLFQGVSLGKFTEFPLGQNKTAQQHAKSGATSLHTISTHQLPSPFCFSCYPCCFRTGCCCHPKTVLSKICTAMQLCTMATFFKVLPNFLGHPFFKTITWPWKSLPCSRPSC